MPDKCSRGRDFIISHDKSLQKVAEPPVARFIHSYLAQIQSSTKMRHVHGAHFVTNEIFIPKKKTFLTQQLHRCPPLISQSSCGRVNTSLRMQDALTSFRTLKLLIEYDGGTTKRTIAEQDQTLIKRRLSNRCSPNANRPDI